MAYDETAKYQINRSDLAGAAIGGLSNAVPTDRQTFLDPLNSTHGSINELLGRLQFIADRLCGPVPEQGQVTNEAKLSPVPNGLFDELSTRGVDMHRKLSRMHDLVGRIERSLP